MLLPPYLTPPLEPPLPSWTPWKALPLQIPMRKKKEGEEEEKE
jgi:hypothetical protein